MHRPQTGNCRRKLTASSGASDFAISGRRLLFVQEIGELAEAEGHHPTINFGWGNATASPQTKKIKGLHENDFIMATKIDAYSLARLRRERVLLVLQLAPAFRC
jgi:pterin-4a-carbinolamine dehydratase